MEGGNENCLDELSYRLCFPLPKPDLPDGIESFLSSFPWKIQWDDENVENPETGIAGRVLPSYLDLRRKQNIAFADEKCREANKMLESPGNDAKAKDSFTKALDLVPEHLDSLIGYGKLLIKTGKLSKAEGFLRSALRVDATSVEAQQCLAKLQERRRETVLGQTADPASYSLVGGTNFSKPQDSSHLSLLLNNNTVNKNQKSLTARKSSAYMDALMERNLHADPSLPEAGRDFVENNEKGGDSSSHDSSIHNRSDRDDRRDKRKSKRKDHHRRHRRDKRKRSRSSRSRRRRSKEKKRKKKRSNRRRTRDDTSSHSFSSESSLYSSSSYLSSSESYSSVPTVISTRSLTETDLHEKKLKEEDKHSKSHSTHQSQAPKDKRRGDLDDAYNDYDERADDLSRYRKKRSHHRYDDDKKRRHKRKKDSKRHKRRKDHRRRGTED